MATNDLVDQLVLLGQVEDAYNQEAGNWFTNLLVDFGQATGGHTVYFSNFEVEYKERTQSTSMPSVYRSAKSVILQGYKYGIDMWDPELMGKTAIEKAIKEYKQTQTKLVTDEEVFSSLVQDTDNLLRRIDSVVADEHREQLINYLQTSIASLFTRS